MRGTAKSLLSHTAQCFFTNKHRVRETLLYTPTSTAIGYDTRLGPNCDPAAAFSLFRPPSDGRHYCWRNRRARQDTASRRRDGLQKRLRVGAPPGNCDFFICLLLLSSVCFVFHSASHIGRTWGGSGGGRCLKIFVRGAGTGRAGGTMVAVAPEHEESPQPHHRSVAIPPTIPPTQRYRGWWRRSSLSLRNRRTIARARVCAYVCVCARVRSCMCVCVWCRGHIHTGTLRTHTNLHT